MMLTSQRSAFKKYIPRQPIMGIKRKQKRITKQQLRQKAVKIRQDNKRKKDASKTSKHFQSFAIEEIKISQISCPICLQIFVCPSSLECGHIFCLSCLDTAIQTSHLCPLCRHTISSYDFKQSKFIETLIRRYTTHNLNHDQFKVYLQRTEQFNKEEQKRRLPSVPVLYSFIDFRSKKQWITGRIQEISGNYVIVSIYEKEAQKVIVNRNSRNIARYRSQFRKAYITQIKQSLWIDTGIDIIRRINHTIYGDARLLSKQVIFISEFEYYHLT